MGSAEKFLRRIGVTNFVPGFMDDPAFLVAEQADPTILEKYAEFIEQRHFDEEYLAKARQRISQLVAYVYPLLVKQGRLGACVDASAALARMLEREGLWCYCVSGALSTYPEPWTGVPPSHYAPICNQPGTAAAHAWVVAPPFRVIDLTVSIQPNVGKAERRVLPDYVLSEDAKRVASEPADWIEPPVWDSVVHSLGHEPTLDDVRNLAGRGFDIAAEFGTWEVALRRGKLRYVTVAFGGFKEQLEDVKNIRFGGDYPLDVLKKFREKHPG